MADSYFQFPKKTLNFFEIFKNSLETTIDFKKVLFLKNSTCLCNSFLDAYESTASLKSHKIFLTSNDNCQIAAHELLIGSHSLLEEPKYSAITLTTICFFIVLSVVCMLFFIFWKIWRSKRNRLIRDILKNREKQTRNLLLLTASKEHF